VRGSSTTRSGVLAEVSLKVTEFEGRWLSLGTQDPPSLLGLLLPSDAGSTQWASTEEVTAAVAWLDTMAGELDEPDVGHCLVEHPHPIRAEWCWPDSPAIAVLLDGELFASADYLAASASAHWFLRWTRDAIPSHEPVKFPLLALATRVQEELDEDDAMRAASLDTVIEAAASGLAGRPVSLETRDA
jgi:hypothetical protein